MIDIPCITLILSKIGKSLLNFPLLIFVIRPDSQCDSLGVFYAAYPKCKGFVLYLGKTVLIHHCSLFNEHISFDHLIYISLSYK